LLERTSKPKLEGGSQPQLIRFNQTRITFAKPTHATRYGYTSREVDSDADLLYYRSRWYDTRQGRFISQDPIGLVGGINLYTYVENDPLRFSDPSGLYPPEREEPCNSPKNWKRKLRDFREIGNRIGWRIADNGRPRDVRKYSYKEVLRRLEKAGFEWFPNANYPHWGGTDYEGKINRRWYHVTVFYPKVDESRPPSDLAIQCEEWYYILWTICGIGSLLGRNRLLIFQNLGKKARSLCSKQT